MPNKSWKEIWNGKKVDEFVLLDDEFEMFCLLKKMDGFDVNVNDEREYFEQFYTEWNKMNDKIINLINDFQSVYEVGCGDGVNLYMFKRRYPNIDIGGLDYSKNLLDFARTILKDGVLEHKEAIEVDESVKYDIVISDSVFQYFPSEEYASLVLHKMCKKARKLVYLGELHDRDLKKEWLENRRKAILNYDELYKGLGRTFVTRKWIEDIAAFHKRRVVFDTKNNEAYWSSSYIFDAYIY